ncbi:cell division protein FtsJ [Paenibacillus polygoni]|uniref:Cell division protein FtsJ n=1 Tax=Paenibacillus polygoni TaxID=3050112 RepID=A0ABY8WXL0_9BACL|nr:cyclic-phosphate processing receiver domain-containing protein [Paenibacillus polygoni]WIV17826.1 cell division protein FtsJ [Paenibacillus polygoni]
MNLFLDDYRTCPPGFTLARDVEECKLLLIEYDVNILSLDYDLGYGNPTGLDIASFIVNKQMYPNVIYLHTSSDAGRRAMYELLYMNKPDRTEVHNGPMPQELLEQIAQTSRIKQ